MITSINEFIKTLNESPMSHGSAPSNIDTSKIPSALSDQNEQRPDRMKAPDSTQGHEFSLYNSRTGRGGLYIQDHMHDMLVDKYGKERGEKVFAGILDTRGGAFFAYGDKIAREKSYLLNALGIRDYSAFSDYFKYSYFALWKMWMDKIGKPYKIPTPEEIQARKDEAERVKREQEEAARQARLAQTKADFDNELNRINTNYSDLIQYTPDAKDMDRINGLFAKRNMSTDVPKMANSIKDKVKAARRGNAVIKHLIDNNKFSRYDLSHAKTFFDRANRL